MDGLTKRRPSADGLVGLELVNKHFPNGNFTRPRAESAAQSSSSRPPKSKSRWASFGSVASLRARHERNNSDNSHDDDDLQHQRAVNYQLHATTNHSDQRDAGYKWQQASDDIWDSFWEGRPGESKEDVQYLLRTKQYPAQITSVELESLPSPPPNKPLPALPCPARPRTAPQPPLRPVPVRVPIPVAVPVSTQETVTMAPRNPQDTLTQPRKVGATYSPFPKSKPQPPFPVSPKSPTKTPTPSWQSSREAQKSQQLQQPQKPAQPEETEVKRALDWEPEAYQKALETPNDPNRHMYFQELYEDIVSDPPAIKARPLAGPSAFIRPLSEVIMAPDVMVEHPSPRSIPGSALFLPPIEHNWDESTPILARPESPKDLLSREPQEVNKVNTAGRPPLIAARGPYSRPPTRGRRPTVTSLETCPETKSLGELSPAPVLYPKPLNVCKATMTDTPAADLTLPDTWPRLMLAAKSVPDFQNVSRLQPAPSAKKSFSNLPREYTLEPHPLPKKSVPDLRKEPRLEPHPLPKMSAPDLRSQRGLDASAPLSGRMIEFAQVPEPVTPATPATPVTPVTPVTPATPATPPPPPPPPPVKPVQPALPAEPAPCVKSIWEYDDDDFRSRFSNWFRIFHRRGSSDSSRWSKRSSRSQPSSPRSALRFVANLFSRRSK